MNDFVARIGAHSGVTPHLQFVSLILGYIQELGTMTVVFSVSSLPNRSWIIYQDILFISLICAYRLHSTSSYAYWLECVERGALKRAAVHRVQRNHNACSCRCEKTLKAWANVRSRFHLISAHFLRELFCSSWQRCQCEEMQETDSARYNMLKMSCSSKYKQAVRSV